MMATLLLTLALSPLVGVAIGLWLRRRFPQTRWLVLFCVAMEILVVAACVYISSIYPGPEGQYIQGSFAWSVREKFFMPSGIFVGTLPVWVALGTFNLFPGAAQSRCAAIVAALAGYLSTPITFGLLLAIGCNHAGACL